MAAREVLPALRQPLRNAGAVFALCGAIQLLKRMGRKRQRDTKAQRADPECWGPRPSPADEAARTAAAIFLCGVVHSWARQRGPGWAAALASYLPLRLLLSSTRQLRASYDFLAAAIAAPSLVHAVPRLRDNPVLVMQLATAQLVCAWVLSDSHLPPTYLRFLNSQSRLPAGALEKGVREVVLPGRPCGDLHYRTAWEEGRWTVMRVPDPMSLEGKSPAAVKRESTLRAATDYWASHLTAVAFPLYLRINLLRLAVAAAKGKLGVSELVALVRDSLRSALFLSTYVTWTWSLPFALGTVCPSWRLSPPRLWALALTSGAWLLLERPSQRAAISAYCAPFGVYPLLHSVPFGFDAAAVASLVAIGNGWVPTPALLKLVWAQ